MQYEEAWLIILRSFVLACILTASGSVRSDTGIRYFSDVNTLKNPPHFVEEIEEGGRVFEGFSYYSVVFDGGRVVEYHKCRKRKVLYWVRFLYGMDGAVVKRSYYDLDGKRVVVDGYLRGRRDVRQIFPISDVSESHVSNACGTKPSPVAR